MTRNRIIIMLIACLSGLGIVCAQPRPESEVSRDEFRVNFRVGTSVLERDFSDNAVQLQRLGDYLQQIKEDTLVEVERITFYGTTSPEGSYEINRKLSARRMTEFEKILRELTSISEETVEHDDVYIPWDSIKQWVENSELDCKDKVISILEEEPCLVKYVNTTTIDNRVKKLRNVDNGRVWRRMNSEFFADMRSAGAVIVTVHRQPPMPEPETEPEVIIIESAVIEPEPEPTPEPEPVKESGFQRRAYLKTNALGWAMSMANVAGEVDLGRHVSVALPVYYSAVNYFTRTLKFRTFALQPEVRVWTSSEANDGLYFGAHFGVAWYDYAFDGRYRYQDHGRHTPALGGGIGVGYRLPLGHSGRWRLEFALGAGAYRVHYDKFLNESNGRLTGSERKTYVGLDQAAATVAYTFDIGKKGGVGR